MSTFYKFTQGVQERIRVYNQTAVLYLKNTTSVLTFSNVEAGEEEGEYWLTFTIDNDNFMQAGIAQYQLFEGNQLKEYGSCQIIPSMMIDPNQELRSKYAIIVEAIEARLAGTATKAQRDVSVGDKKIGYMSASQLLSLLDYFKGKLAEEEAGSNVNPKTDQLRILYKWTLR